MPWTNSDGADGTDANGVCTRLATALTLFFKPSSNFAETHLCLQYCRVPEQLLSLQHHSDCQPELSKFDWPRDVWAILIQF